MQTKTIGGSGDAVVVTVDGKEHAWSQPHPCNSGNIRSDLDRIWSRPDKKSSAPFSTLLLWSRKGIR